MQLRLESKRRRPEAELESQVKKVKLNAPPTSGAMVDDLKDEWVVKANKVTRQRRAPRSELYFPTGGNCPVDRSNLKPGRFTHAIVNDTGVMHERTGEWNSGDQTWTMGNPFKGQWAGWTESETNEDQMEEPPRAKLIARLARLMGKTPLSAFIWFSAGGTTNPGPCQW